MSSPVVLPRHLALWLNLSVSRYLITRLYRQDILLVNTSGKPPGLVRLSLTSL